MNLLRSTSFCRAIAGFAIVCLIGMTVVPSYAHRATFTSYGDWLRSQIQGGTDDTFDRALARVSADRSTSIEHFLHAFVESWDAEGDLEDLAAIFGVDGIDGSLLVSYLQSRFSGLTPDALPTRTLITVPTPSATGSDRCAGGEAVDSSARSKPTMVWVPSDGREVQLAADVRQLLTSIPRLGP